MNRRGAGAAAIIIAVVAGFGVSVFNGFVYDDVASVAANPIVTHARWHDVLWHTYWLGTLWRPWTTAGFTLQWIAGGGAPWVFHAVSLAVYAAVGLALAAVLRRAAVAAGGAASIIAIVVTVLFLVDPVHVEAVAGVVGQAELWTALAMLAAVLLYLGIRDEGAKPGRIAALLTMVFIGIASKEQGFFIPAVLIGLDLLAPGRRVATREQRLRVLGAVTLLALAMFVVRASVVGGALGETPAVAWRGVGAGGRMLTLLAVLPLDARLIFWPWHLAVEYGPPSLPVGGPFTLRHAVGALLLLAAVAAFVVTRRRAPWCAFGLWCAAVMLGPVANVVAPTGLITAERVLFLPSIGLAIAAAAAVTALVPLVATSRGAAGVVIAVVSALGVVLVVRSAQRSTVWHDQSRFFDQLVADAPETARAWKVAGEYWQSAGDTGRAIGALRRSWQLWPRDAAVPERLGQIYRQAGRCNDAVPVFAAGLTADSTAESLRAKLVECLIRLRRWDAAMAAAIPGSAAGVERVRAARRTAIR